jgi:hypothetical protein
MCLFMQPSGVGVHTQGPASSAANAAAPLCKVMMVSLHEIA